MDPIECAGRLVDALENIAAELERLRVLKGHELAGRGQTRCATNM